MQNSKKTVMLMISFMMVQCAYGSQAQATQSTFQQGNTEEYTYTKNSSVKPANEESTTTIEPIVISDNTAENYLNTGKTRVLVTLETKNGTVVTTTETWTTKNPSYVTKTNTALITTAAIAAVTIASIAGYSILSIKKYITESPEDITRNLNPKWSYADFMQRIKNNSRAGIRTFVKENCSTLGSGYGTSEQEIGKYEQAANDLYERNKVLIATHAYNPFEVARLLQENMMIATFKNGLRQVEAQYAKENKDIFGGTTTATGLAKNAALGAAALGATALAVKKSR